MGIAWWPALVFGWPGPILAIVLCVAGIVRARVVWLVVAAAVIVPFSLYLAMNPDTGWGIALPFLPLLAAAATSRGSKLMAWPSVLLLTAILSWIAGRVFDSPFTGG